MLFSSKKISPKIAIFYSMNFILNWLTTLRGDQKFIPYFA